MVDLGPELEELADQGILDRFVELAKVALIVDRHYPLIWTERFEVVPNNVVGEVVLCLDNNREMRNLY